MVGTFHAAGEVPYQWLRPALRSLMMRLTFRVAVSESARETAAGNWTGAEYTVLWNGIEIEPHRVGRARAVAPADRCCSSAATSRARDSRCLLDAWAGIDRDARLQVVGVGPQTEELQQPRGRRRRVVRRRHRRAAQRAAARRDGVLRAVAARASRSASCCSKAMAAGAPIVASAIEGYENVARAGSGRVAGAAGRRRGAARRACAGCSTTPALRARLVASGRERAEQFSMRAARRALPRALRPRAGAGGVAE